MTNHGVDRPGGQTPAAQNDGAQTRAAKRADRLAIRRAEPEDIPAMAALSQVAAAGVPPCEPGMARGRIAAFPEGQFVAARGGRIVGFAATLRLSEADAFRSDSWAEATGGGFAARHDGRGDWLYRIETTVAPGDGRGVAARLEEACRRLAQDQGLKGVALTAPAPGYARRRPDFPTVQGYCDAVAAGTVQDPATRRRLRAGYEPVRLLRDAPGGGAAAAAPTLLMQWRNPSFDPARARSPRRRGEPQIVRVAAAQLQMRPARDLDALADRVAFFIDIAASYDADFVVFPELFSLALLAGQPRRIPADEAMPWLAEATPDLVARMAEAAVAKKINVIGGSHPRRTAEGAIRNTAYACLRGGAVVMQDKLHPTPDERAVWGIEGGDAVEAFETDRGPAAMLICYDAEFPELARRVADQGTRLLFAPYATDGRAGHLRVTLCCQARAIENQLYVVTAGNVGAAQNVDNMDVNYAQSGVYTPCDHAFARDGIAAEASENVEMMATADLDLTALGWARSQGSVRNFRDRRFDLYRIAWTR